MRDIFYQSKPELKTCLKHNNEQKTRCYIAHNYSSRITKIGPTIDSLINQSYKVDAIYISIPPFCDRLGTKYPEYVFPPEVTIIHPSKDYGPATKLLGLLECVDVKDYIVIVDDDRHYDKELVEKLLAKSDEEPNSIINGFPVKVQFAGAPGVLVRKQFIDKCIFKIPLFVRNDNALEGRR